MFIIFLPELRFYMLIKVWPTLMTHLRLRKKRAVISYQATRSKNLWTLLYILTEIWHITMKEEGRSVKIHAVGDIEDSNNDSDHTWKELVASDKSSWVLTPGREFICRPLGSLNPDCLKTARTYQRTFRPPGSYRRAVFRWSSRQFPFFLKRH